MSHWGPGPESIGGSLLGSLASIGIVTGPEFASVPMPGSGMGRGWFNQSSQNSQLSTDMQQLETDLQALAAKSTVTVADLQNLDSDSQSIAQAGLQLNAKSLNTVTSELATAVAGGSDTTKAQADFKALFASSSVSQAAIDKAFTDMVQAITASKVTTTDLTRIANDQAAIQSDLTKLGRSSDLTGAPGFGSPGGFGDGGGTLGSSLSYIGVVTGSGAPGIAEGGEFGHHGSTSSSQPTQLQTDTQKLTTDLQTLGAKSGVTVADLNSLGSDTQAIAKAGARLDPTATQKAVTELATAVVNNADQTQAKADFSALFSGTSVSQTVIDQALADIVKVVTDSTVTATDLALITADRAAIQNDFNSLHSTTHTTTTATSTTASSSATSASSNTTTTSTTTTASGPSRAGVHRRVRAFGRHGRF